MWTSSMIRKSFLDFFSERHHQIVESSSLVPVDDNTLLFANAGMNQFKNIFVGLEKKSYTRAASAQKCLRAGGKHNDLDTVGKTARHHTFFEMLGNFSFGDYFKSEAIAFAWEFLTEKAALPKDKLWITIYQDDDEAETLWRNVAGVDGSRIIRLGEKDNFWSMGDTGPCGPCSEIMYDRGEKFSCGDNCGIGLCECDRYLEIWNLVFMQFNRGQDGQLSPLPKPSIDTGMGLERLTSILQDVPSNFDTDLFTPIIAAIEKMTKQRYRQDAGGFPFRVIADHSRACVFLVADGILPSNEGRGYVLRRILRRAVRFGKLLGLEQPFLYRNVDVVCDLMKEAYPYLTDKQNFIKDVIRLEEERFFITLNDGMKKLEDILSKIKAEGKTCIEPQDAFMLYDTYGFPVDLTEDAALEQGLTVDRDALEALMEEQRERGRQSGKTESNTLSELVLSRLLDEFPPTVFKGYELLKCFSKILTFIEGENSVPKAGSGQVFIITDQTVFYAESGGQTSDHGSIKGQNGECRVTYVKKAGKWYIHSGELRGILRQGETVHMEVDEKRRLATARNHSATHLLHKALHTVLGSHAQQKGSLVEPHRLRFDFSHLAMVSAEEQQAVENMVNEAIWSNLPVKTQTMSLKEAKQSGAEALFNEKYGDSVRVVMMGDYSKELCGGTHVEQTGRIGLFKITSEGSVGSGLRRIEAITGSYALDYFNRLEKGFLSAAGMMKVKPDGLTLKIRQLNSSLKEKDKEIERLKADLLRGEQKNLADLADNINGTAVLVEKVTSGDVNELRQSAEKLKDQLGSAVVLLAAPVNDKIAIVCFVSKNLLDKGLHAGRLVETTAKITGGGGGGRADMAQAGGKNTEKLPEALNEIRQIIINLLNQ